MNLELALRMCEAAVRQAAREGALISVAVVDAGGHLVAFQRMDGARITGPVLAPGKAYTAVAHRMPTADLAPLVLPGGELYGLAGDRYVCFGGGVPLGEAGDERGVSVVSAVAGAVGVSGGTVSQDVACAEAAAALWEGA
ncbi:GlcG/HbpS family heme-binding protein [Streptosporangium sp. H16]|uniref:GlcG/HbpS family heme-binding protein n=1 Tax=Streptosporangium sp. H16 TaxID=3444184 RepID=UPI003F79F9BC